MLFVTMAHDFWKGFKTCALQPLMLYFQQAWHGRFISTFAWGMGHYVNMVNNLTSICDFRRVLQF